MTAKFCLVMRCQAEGQVRIRHQRHEDLGLVPFPVTSGVVSGSPE